MDGSVVCIEDEIPFEIPETWAWVKFGNICNIARGGSPRPIEAYLTDNKNGINWIKIGDTEKGGKYIYSTKEKIKPEGMSKSRYVKAGDFLLTNSMSFGRPYILKTDGCIHDGWLVINDDFKVFNQDFLYYLLSSDIMYQLLALSAKGSTVQNLKSDTVKETYVAIPPISEQIRIAEYTENLLNIIENINLNKLDLSALIKQTKSKVLDFAIKGKLVPQDSNDEPADKLLEKIREEKEKLIKEGKLKRDKNETFIFKNSVDNSYYEQIDGETVCIDDDLPFEIPDSWRWCKINNIAQNVMYGLSNSAESSGNCKLLRITDIQNNAVNWDKVPYTNISNMEASTYQLNSGDIVFARTGATVGKSYLITECPDNTVYASYLIKIHFFNNILSEYIYNFFNSSFYWEQIIDMSSGIGQPNVNGTSLKELLLPIPPLNEQKRIAIKIKSIFTLLDTIQEIFLQ